ncbi:MAG: protease modulator HflK [Verrucomicrobiota bacterium]
MKKSALRQEGRPVEALLILLKHLTAHARWVFAALLGLYAVSGIRTIQPQEQALLLRFGRLQPEIHGPGLLIGFPEPFDRVLRFETGKDRGLPLDRWALTGTKIGDPDKVIMLSNEELIRQVKQTGNGSGTEARHNDSADATLDPVRHGYTVTADSNLIQGRFLLRYRIESPFLYASVGEGIDGLLECLSFRALTHQLSVRKIDAALTSDRQDLAESAARSLQEEATRLGLGIRVSGLDIRELSPPSQVLAAFEDVVNARQFAKTLYENSRQQRVETLARSGGEAAAIRQRAEAWAATKKVEAAGEASSFLALLENHRLSPDLVDRRLLRETLDTVMGQIQSRTLLPAGQAIPSLMIEPAPGFAR